MKKLFVSSCLLFSLAACGNLDKVQVQPAKPQVTNQIISACLADGVFVNLGGRLVLQNLPYAGVVDKLLAAGVDKVCEDPEKFSSDLSTAEWVVENIRSVLIKK